MAKILDSAENLTGNTPKFLETSSNFYLNGHYYNKNLSVRPFEYYSGCNSITTDDNNPFAKTIVDVVPTSNGGNRIEKGLMIDNNNFKKTYLLNDLQDTFKLIEIDQSSEGEVPNTRILRLYGSGDNYNYPNSDIGYTKGDKTFLSQDDRFIYVMIKTGVLINGEGTVGGTGNIPEIIKIDKETLKINNRLRLPQTNYGFTHCKLLSEYKSFFFISCSNTLGNLKVVAVDKFTLGLKTIYDSGSSVPWKKGIRKCSIPSDLVYGIGDVLYFFTILSTYDEELGTYRNILSKIELQRDLLQCKLIETDIELTMINSMKHSYYEFITVTDDNGNYVVSIPIDPNPNSEHMPEELNNITVYRVTNENIEEVSKISDISPTVFKNVIKMDNNKTLVLPSKYRTDVYTWNKATKKYDLSFTDSNMPKYVFKDSNDGLWIQDIYKAVHYVRRTTAANVVTRFNMDEYEFKGEPINTYAIIEVTNLEGKAVQADLEVQLFGPAKFTTNHLTKMTITTSKSGSSSIPVTITGEGKITLKPKILL